MSEAAERIIIYGAGGMGREILDILRRTNCVEGAVILGFVDDGVPPGTVRNDIEVLGGMNYLKSTAEPRSVVLGMAAPDAKRAIHSELKQNPLISFPNVIHPTSCVSEYALLGEGVVIATRCEVGIDAVIGDCVFLNANTLVGHDARVGRYTSIMSMTIVSGCTDIGEGCMLGAHSALRQGIRIGPGCMIGMGSVVLRDVPDGATVLGNPARRIS
jgi:sugar O-acyltransferase (sialic acid O-acetyltransferase NeuD family)